ncbi:MAG: hypothetical protein A2487_02140 [Candidatus Raymondbacteria bacterium RifOxyC12_full_50_8]|uniref:Transposase n=1 Tax=Candidatus Raymondbacteria bacterium RIFOXYD12_FULL_49_13 TaxID=1817890 RepID=A0A1F7FHT9_UNCRA|nr:MAG: hypothetical protein A2248_00830 [Candidatus Raymondbacteria bacterium RIFOXYA2_FULL_49_16]OGJ95876.1 MAG: hypothetical protein A2350_13400 [Candidatus Raymondbacteria bacterium RifOxyB12_full_50_8]OGK04879.1 MAG: hypothetical protein A2487_02140 [Candidatus Raymondbacteria bacterium RifOxyC12_full_50_8]OGK06016.1 MAG: hypothetical protein A2519_14700 [Candidatus Raymondbacteria bacterium RIFOXYD12_FULL_49_13]OGP42250.1 MAG: hypothetical protein A2324_01375 [Candidatus Raymondbacteria b
MNEENAGHACGRRRYDTSFKRSIVKMLLERGRPTNVVAKEFDLDLSILYKWKKKYAPVILSSSSQYDRKTISPKEIAIIRKEIIDLRESMSVIKSVLKKTLTNICDF